MSAGEDLAADLGRYRLAWALNEVISALWIGVAASGAPGAKEPPSHSNCPLKI
jgi:hypothetical protein